MFNIGPWELALVAVIALLVLGPGKLPQLGSDLGRTMREFRRAVRETAGDAEENKKEPV